MPFKIVRNDITKMQVDVIVNTANEASGYSTGVDTAVYKAAGEELLLAERKKIGWMEEGDVAITPGFHLPSKYIIHAVSPYYIDGTFGEEERLRSCYKKSLQLAYENDCKSIAFPLISTGGFGYPKEEGMRIALDEINAFLLSHEMLIYLVVFDSRATQLGLSLYPDLEEYIDHNYVCEKREEEYGDQYFSLVRENSIEYDAYINVRSYVEKSQPYVEEAEENLIVENLTMCTMEPITNCGEMSDEEYEEYIEEKENAIKERMNHLSDTFQEYLFYLIKTKGLENADVYKRAIIDKRQFSKIKKNPKYHPEKSTALRLCVGALLNLDETIDLLARAGYALSPCDKRDVIFKYFIEREIYDAMEIEITLEENGVEGFMM